MVSPQFTCEKVTIILFWINFHFFVVMQIFTQFSIGASKGYYKCKGVRWPMNHHPSLTKHNTQILDGRNNRHLMCTNTNTHIYWGGSVCVNAHTLSICSTEFCLIYKKAEWGLDRAGERGGSCWWCKHARCVATTSAWHRSSSSRARSIFVLGPFGRGEGGGKSVHDRRRPPACKTFG